MAVGDTTAGGRRGQDKGLCDIHSCAADVDMMFLSPYTWYTSHSPVMQLLSRLCYPDLPGHPQKNNLEGLVIDEWRGASGGATEIICDAVGNNCPWSATNGTHEWNISAAAAVLMVRS